MGKGMGVVAADLDGDGWVDIFVANDTVPNFLFHNNGNGTFKEVGAYSGVAYSQNGQAKSGMGADIGDFNGDGRPDILMTALSQYGATLYRNEGGGFFADVSSQFGLTEPTFLLGGWGVKFLDYDNDGDQDIFITNGHVMDDIASYTDALTNQQPGLLLENRQGQFFDITPEQPAPMERRAGRGLAVGDFDNDGDLDMLLNNNNQPSVLLRNDGGNRNNWIKLKLVGTKSNRDGIGARVRVVSGELVETDQVKGGGSYLSANDPRLNFGLGKRQVVDSVEIQWPSGIKQTLKGLGVNQIVTVREP
jgi:enediyne biosynthesis protein E4